MTMSVVGIGADGWDGLAPAGREALLDADVVLGAERHVGLLPSQVAAERRAWPSPLRAGLPGVLAEIGDRKVVALASGDPFLSGIATTLVDLLGPDGLDEVIPAVSSVALARAAMRWSAESTTWCSLVGRDVARLLRYAEPGARLLALAADGTTTSHIAELLTSAGFGDSTITALSELGGAGESRREGLARSWEGTTGTLTIVAIECRGTGAWWGRTPGLADDAFEHDGQLTKRDLRATALARLAPRPGELLWDVGAGAGSVGIEWLRAHPRNRAVAIERDAQRVARIGRNAARLGVPELVVEEGAAPAALAGLDRPDAVFVGGGASRDGVLDTCWNALPSWGRLVVHGVTIETETLLAQWHARHGGELVRIAVERAEPIGGFTGWSPARAVVQWAVTKP